MSTQFVLQYWACFVFNLLLGFKQSYFGTVVMLKVWSWSGSTGLDLVMILV